MTITVLKMHIRKQKPRYVSYRCYKNFKEDDFRRDLLYHLHSLDIETMNYETFSEIFKTLINQYAPMKQKIVRGTSHLSRQKSYQRPLCIRLN